MKGAIFHDDIESFDSALKRNGEYEISDAPIKVIPEQFSSKVGELQMNFNDRVKIIPVSLNNCSDEPQYTKLSAIPVAEQKTEQKNEMLLDILGVVLFVSETREVNVGHNIQHVRDIYITDDSFTSLSCVSNPLTILVSDYAFALSSFPSSPRPMVLSAWNDFTRQECKTLSGWAQSSMVVGFVGVQPVTRKEEPVKRTPGGDVASKKRKASDNIESLKVVANETLLSDRSSKLLGLLFPSSQRAISTISEMLGKRVQLSNLTLQPLLPFQLADTTWQEEKLWLEVTIPNASATDIYCYHGCNKCGRTTSYDEGMKFRCANCKTVDAISTPRY
ncbi:Replication protein A 70 kDa DNA-binding subunit [Bienertia sinuspersici]